jgi:hAT family C-terminal dimerisation region
MKEALLVYTKALTYLEKWFSFNTSPYCKFKALSLGNLTNPTTLDEVIEISDPNLLKIVQYGMLISVSNANVERIFSVMGNVLTDERNRLCVESTRSELCIFLIIPYNCTEFKDAISKNYCLIV